MRTILELKPPEFRTRLAEFLAVYEKRPFPRNGGGMELEGHFILWHVLKELEPLDLVIESGVWFGWTSWLIEQARPGGKTLHFDPMLKICPSWTHWRDGGEYSGYDFLTLDKAPSKTLVIFDDHQNILPRLEWCLKLSIKHILWDDNWDTWADHMTFKLYEKWFVPMAGEVEGERARYALARSNVTQYHEFPRIPDPVFETQRRHEFLTYTELP